MGNSGRTYKTNNLNNSDRKISRKSISSSEAESTVIPASITAQNSGFPGMSPEYMLEIQQTCGNSYVQRMADGNSAALKDSEIEEELNRHREPGAALQPEVQGKMQKALGHNFNDIRIHNDPEANQLSADLGASAFTSGNDIYFKQGKFNPASSKGNFLLGHELGHHIQQHKSENMPREEHIISDKTLENEADMAGEAVVSGTSFTVSTYAPGGIQMGDEDEEGGGVVQWVSERLWFTDAYADRVAGMLEEAIDLFAEPALDAGLAAFRQRPDLYRQISEYRTGLDDVAFTVEHIKRLWDIAEVGDDIIRVVEAFRAWNPDTARENPRLYAQQAGRALAALGDLGDDAMPDELGGAGAYFDLLSNCGNFFTDMIDSGRLNSATAALNSGEFRSGTRDEQREVRSVMTE
jgi:hypothetical protein